LEDTTLIANNTYKEVIEVWNIQDGIPVYAGAQSILNIIGRLNNAETVETLVYSLNGRPEVRVFFRNGSDSVSRLAQQGDFNIDTITRDQLFVENNLKLIARLKDGTRVSRSYMLAINTVHWKTSRFSLDLGNIMHPQEQGQLVDGKWRVGRDERGLACLEILPEDAGLDRIILFGTDELGSGYTIRARLKVNKWLRPMHNAGLLFLWNPHLQGDGTCLPGQWTTGLGYYYSHCAGLRIRIGVDVHLDGNRKRVGDTILGEAALSSRRYWTNMIVRNVTRGRWWVPQMVPGLEYWFELKVDSDAYALTVWPITCMRPPPQVVVTSPPELLATGAVGIIAHYCAVRVYEFHLEPHSETKSG
jgi:hypothetical protein